MRELLTSNVASAWNTVSVRPAIRSKRSARVKPSVAAASAAVIIFGCGSESFHVDVEVAETLLPEKVLVMHALPARAFGKLGQELVQQPERCR